jgi:hypothetical protein
MMSEMTTTDNTSLVRVVRNTPQAQPITVGEYDLAESQGALDELLRSRGYVISMEPRNVR